MDHHTATQIETSRDRVRAPARHLDVGAPRQRPSPRTTVPATHAEATVPTAPAMNLRRSIVPFVAIMRHPQSSVGSCKIDLYDRPCQQSMPTSPTPCLYMPLDSAAVTRFDRRIEPLGNAALPARPTIATTSAKLPARRYRRDRSTVRPHRVDVRCSVDSHHFMGSCGLVIPPPRRTGDAMARFLINRVWEPMDEAELGKMAGVSKRLIDEQFVDLVWEHSHVVTDAEGADPFVLRVRRARRAAHQGPFRGPGVSPDRLGPRDRW